jgi:acyl-[acyl-carrier-protein]-phospholipid O-acyltransferase/long-chain-fatty-acid--[acyl-carrier-protein] ligase
VADSFSESVVADVVPPCAAFLTSEPESFVWLGLVALVLVLLLPILFPSAFLFRPGLWLLTHTVFRLRRGGRDHVPRQGGVLLIANHLPFFDWVYLLAAAPRRVRVVVVAGWVDGFFVRRLLAWSNAIAVSPKAGAEAVRHTLRQAGAAVAAGEVVCLIAQGRAVPDSFELPFSKQYETVAACCPAAPVVPVDVAQVWGSLYHPRGNRLIHKHPQELPYRVWVNFGPPLPPGTSAGLVCQALHKLSADAAIARNAQRRPVHRQFLRLAARHPFRTCAIDSLNPKQPLTYGKALAGVLCLMELLRPRLGEAPMVALWLPPGVGSLLSNIALAFLGRTSVNLNYTAGPDAIRSALRQCGASRVLTARRFTNKVPLEGADGVELLYLDDLLPLVTKWAKLWAFLKVLLLPGWLHERLLGLHRHNAADLATIIFSSGSTGEPKGVMLSHGNVAANIESMVLATGLDRTDRMLGVLPFFHSFGYTVTLWGPLQIGASAVYHADPRQAREIGDLCRKYRATIYVSTATFLRFCLKKCDTDDFRSLRILMCGAEKLPVSLAEEFQRRFGVLPLEGYGTTELSPAAAANMPDEEIGGCVEISNRSGTIGPPLPGCAVRIAHPETLEPLPPGTDGLVLVYGANVMCGYLGKPEVTASVVRDGWYITGDMGRIDADGFVTLTGRLARFAKVGGEMVPLERIEEELHEVLQTSERVCAVTCVPDEARGERLVVLHVQQNGLEVRQWRSMLGGRGLPILWLPSERDFFPVPELPLLGSGKVNLKAVKEMALVLVRR